MSSRPVVRPTGARYSQKVYDLFAAQNEANERYVEVCDRLSHALRSEPASSEAISELLAAARVAGAALRECIEAVMVQVDAEDAGRDSE